MIVVTTNQRVGVFSGGHLWRRGAERARKHGVAPAGDGSRPVEYRTVRESGRWAVVAFQNYATDSEDMASWIRALDVELTAGDITAAEFVTEVRRLGELLKAGVR